MDPSHLALEFYIEIVSKCFHRTKTWTWRSRPEKVWESRRHWWDGSDGSDGTDQTFLNVLRKERKSCRFSNVCLSQTVEEMQKADGPDWQKVLAYVESIFRHFEKSLPLSKAWFFLNTVSVFKVQKQYKHYLGLYFHDKMVSRSTSDFHWLFWTSYFLCTNDSWTLLCGHLWSTLKFGSIFFIYVTCNLWGLR